MQPAILDCSFDNLMHRQQNSKVLEYLIFRHFICCRLW